MSETKTIEDTRLGAMLLESSVLTEEQLERCLEIQALTGGTRMLGQILIEQGILKQELLDDLLQMQATRRAEHAIEWTEPSPGPDRFLLAALMAGANELIVSEGRPVLVRVARQLQQFSKEPPTPPEVWQFVRDLFGDDALDQLASAKSLTRALHRPGLCRGRASAFRHFDGICVHVRLHPEAVRAAEAAGIPPAVKQAVQSGKGLVLVAAQKRSGLTETLASLVHGLLGEKGRLILVLDEDLELPLLPSEAIVIRRQVGEHTASYLSGLRVAIGQEPDVIVVADASSPAAFELALRSAEAGRLVIAGIAARSATAAFERIANFYPQRDVARVRQTLASVLRCILAVQLLPDAQHKTQLLATEVLVVDAGAQSVLRDGTLQQVGLLMQLEKRQNGHSFDDCLIGMVADGRVRFEDAFQYAEDKARVLSAARSAQKART
jgi:twitching motility protein PilT